MKKNKNLPIIFLIFVVLVSAIVIFVTREAPEGPIIDNNNETSLPTTSIPEETLGFNEEGNIMINNPGFEQGSFYLSYGKPGQAGLFKKLIFDEDSICIKDEELNCNELISIKTKEDWSGKRVEVKGSEVEDGVKVERLKFLEEETNTIEQRKEKAINWILNNSPTYNYDGSDLQFIEERGLDLVDCKDCYELEFKFTSSHGGYGNRTGQPVIQVITPHTIVVLLKDGVVTKVTTDGEFNEITGELLN